jgi:death-on-curing protein
VIEPRWILDEVVRAIHKRQLAEHGGAGGVRDTGLLESALSRPKHLFAYAEDGIGLPRLPAAYAFGIARNHPFVDGNKRTAFVAALLFLRLNGYDVVAPQEEKHAVFLAMAEGRLGEDELADWLEAKCRHRTEGV